MTLKLGVIPRDVGQQLQASFSERTISDLGLMFSHRQLNLEPGFQRRSVWALSDRRRLIESIVSRYPLPSIFLYERNSRGRTVYDVLDGKQRVETIFMFMRQGRFKREGLRPAPEPWRRVGMVRLARSQKRSQPPLRLRDLQDSGNGG